MHVQRLALLIIIFSVTGVSLFLGFEQRSLSYAQTLITPTFNSLAPCPTCSDPAITPIVSSADLPTGTVSYPSTAPVVSGPAIAPCDTSDMTIASDNARHHHHRKHHGGISNFMEKLLKFFMELLMKLIELLGGKVNAPSTTGSVEVPSGIPNPNPCDIPETSGAAPQPTPGSTVPSVVQPSVAAPQDCTGSPITITQGGTYSGCYKSTDTSTPAVKIATTAPVTIDHATIQHAGKAIESSMNGVQVTVTNSKIQATNPGAAAIQRAILLNSPASLVAEHNLLVDGQGIWIGGGSPSTVQIRYNDVKNIGRYPHTNENGCCVQFTQFSDTTVGNAEIAWNRTMNTFKQSEVEDNINLWKSSGTAAHPVDIHHNLISGAYPPTVSNSYTGGGILGGDSGGSYINIHDNRVVSSANYGIAITGGHDNHIYGNHIISDGKADDGSAVGPDTASGISLWQYDPNAPTGPNATAYNNTIGWMTPTGKRNDIYIPACNPANACVNNVSMANPTAASEQAERDGWTADAASAGVTIGPNW